MFLWFIILGILLLGFTTVIVTITYSEHRIKIFLTILYVIKIRIHVKTRLRHKKINKQKGPVHRHPYVPKGIVSKGYQILKAFLSKTCLELKIGGYYSLPSPDTAAMLYGLQHSITGFLIPLLSRLFKKSDCSIDLKPDFNQKSNRFHIMLRLRVKIITVIFLLLRILMLIIRKKAGKRRHLNG